jgi:crossover junction endodeoxyribonuclease RusA
VSAQSEWRGRGKVRARRCEDGALEVTIDGVTTQTKYYKPLVYEFFRREAWLRPVYGDFHVSIVMEHVGDPPRMDLDNLAKALCDALTGFAYVDDSQIARLLVERRPGERERISIRATRVATG